METNKKNIVKKNFSAKYLKEELGLPYDCTPIIDRIVDSTRWSVIHDIVFEDKGKFYRTSYSVGATECQDEKPWEYENTVECTEVELREVKVKRWVPVEVKENEIDIDDSMER